MPGLLAGGIDVVGERDPLRISGQERDLAGRERRPERGDDVVEAGLVGHQRVGVALDDHRLAALPDRALGLVDEVQRPALVEERRRRASSGTSGPCRGRRRRCRAEDPAAQPDGARRSVPDREDDPPAEPVVDAAARRDWRGGASPPRRAPRPGSALRDERAGRGRPSRRAPSRAGSVAIVASVKPRPRR